MNLNEKTNMSMGPDVLFALEVIPPTGVELPEKVEVHFEKRFGRYFCELKALTYIGHLRTAEVLKDETAKKLAPLFDYWLEERAVTLTGKYTQNSFMVQNAFSTNLNDAKTEMFIRRLLEHDVPNVRSGTVRSPCRPLKDRDELKAFYRVLGHTLPPELYEWFGNELDTMYNSRSSTLRDQSIQAASMVAAINWGTSELNTPSIETVRRKLDAELYGMEAIKEQLCEIVAMVNRSKAIPKWGILLAGPPGIGKTCIAHVFADAFGLPFASIDFSSLRDDEGLTGSFRIYENSRAGYLFSSLFIARSASVLLLCNEIDKVRSARKSGAGDPTDVLLSLLDRNGYWENFLETTVPTEGIFTIATANDISKLSKPLLDRFIVVDMPAYTPDEKRIIWERFAHPKALAAADVAPSDFALTEQAKQVVISDYAVEPGARDLEKISQRIVGHYCKSDAEHAPHRRYTDKDIRALLGPSKVVRRGFIERPGQISTAYVHGGKVEFFLLEASARKGTGKFRVFGVKADQQKEYCEVAYEAFRSTCPDDLSQVDITLFSPHPLPDMRENYIGCAAFAAIYSALSDTSFDPGKTLFLGGVDLYANIFWDENNIVPLLNALPYRQVKTLFAPNGTSGLIHGNVDARCSVNIVEAPDARLLMTLAGGKTNSR